jgi:hypothetical protein
MDAELARIIFYTVLTADSKTRLGASPAFHSLTISAEGRSSPLDQNSSWTSLRLSELTFWLARSWPCERERADEEGGNVSVQVSGGMWNRDGLAEERIER